jgi:hypothetical protein
VPGSTERVTDSLGVKRTLPSTDLGQPPLEETPLRLLSGEPEGSFVGGSSLRRFSQPPAQLRPRPPVPWPLALRLLRLWERVGRRWLPWAAAFLAVRGHGPA